MTARDDDAAARAEASVRALEAGRLPPAAEERLRTLRDGGSRFFTSDLETSEFLLVREAGFRPLTQVMGSCFYHVGWQGSPAWGMYGSAFASPAGQTIELETLTEAWNEARRLAVTRLEQEATLAGADAVVGVRLGRGSYDWSAGVLEFVVTGTAVASERYDLGGEGPPMLSNLSGQEFAALLRHGWWPAGLVAGSTACYVVTGWAQQSRTATMFGGLQNQELRDFTQGLYDVRTQAMLRVTRQAHELGAHGIVGMRFDRQEEERERDQGGAKFTDLIVTLHVLGTAVVELERTGEDPGVYIALPLTASNEETR